MADKDPNYPADKGPHDTEGGLPPDPEPRRKEVQKEAEDWERDHPKGPF